jgi:chemotaxis protein MotA
MDTIGGVIAAVVIIVGAIVIGGPIGAFIDIPSILVVVGGTVACLFVAFPARLLLATGKVAKAAITSKPKRASEMLRMIQEMANVARRDGVLALESMSANLDDDFVRKGVELVVDGHGPEAVEEVLFTEIDKVEERHALGADIFETVGAISPAMGMIGTLIGLVQMLQNLSDPSNIGPAMAVALITTFYGALIANVVAIPVAKKLRSRSKQEVDEKTLVANGLIAIVKGESPRFVLDRLNASLPPADRLREAS